MTVVKAPTAPSYTYADVGDVARALCVADDHVWGALLRAQQDWYETLARAALDSWEGADRPENAEYRRGWNDCADRIEEAISHR